MNDLYKHLKSYGLIKGREVKQRLFKFSEAKLANFMESYLETARNRPIVIQAPLGVTDIYPDSRAAPPPISTIRQLAIYAGIIHIHDPLLEMAYKWQYLDHTMPLLVKYPTHADRVAYFREELAFVIEKLFILEPLVEAGIIHIAPTELARPKPEPGAMYADDLYGPGDMKNEPLGPRTNLLDLPPQLRKYCQHSLVVWPSAIVNGVPTVLRTEVLTPRNMIAVGFADDPDIYKFYQLFDILPPADAPQTDDTKMSVQMFFDTQHKKMVNLETFGNWVEGSKYKTITEILDRLQQDLMLATWARAKFVTELKSSRDLALLDLSSDTTTASDNIITALMKVELPYFENADLNSIAKARQNEAAFEEFRSAMNKAFREIESLPQGTQFQDQVAEIYRDLLITPLANINRQMNVLKRNLFLGGIIMLGSLAATFVTQGNSLVTAATIYAATEMAKMYKQGKEEEDKVKQLPSFFYWGLTRKT